MPPTKTAALEEQVQELTKQVSALQDALQNSVRKLGSQANQNTSLCSKFNEDLAQLRVDFQRYQNEQTKARAGDITRYGHNV